MDAKEEYLRCVSEKLKLNQEETECVIVELLPFLSNEFLLVNYNGWYSGSAVAIIKDWFNHDD